MADSEEGVDGADGKRSVKKVKAPSDSAPKRETYKYTASSLRQLSYESE